MVVIASPAETGASRASLPERLSWRLSPWALFAGQVDLALTHPSALSQPLTVNAPLFGRAVTLGPTTMRLPASLLVGLGAPWNTIRPGGILTVSWDRLAVEPGRWQGRLSGEWQYASSGLTPVSPMGHYRLQTRVWPELNWITNHFGSPRAQGQWHNQRGGRLLFTTSKPWLATPPVSSRNDGADLVLGRRERRRISVELRWLSKAMSGHGLFVPLVAFACAA